MKTLNSSNSITKAQDDKKIAGMIQALRLVGKSLNFTGDDTNHAIIVAEIIKDFPNASIDEIKQALMEGAKGHYHAYRPGIYMPFNITTIYHWLELKLKNVNKTERMVL